MMSCNEIVRELLHRICIHRALLFCYFSRIYFSKHFHNIAFSSDLLFVCLCVVAFIQKSHNIQSIFLRKTRIFLTQCWAVQTSCENFSREFFEKKYLKNVFRLYFYCIVIALKWKFFNWNLLHHVLNFFVFFVHLRF